MSRMIAISIRASSAFKCGTRSLLLQTIQQHVELCPEERANAQLPLRSLQVQEVCQGGKIGRAHV